MAAVKKNIDKNAGRAGGHSLNGVHMVLATEMQRISESRKCTKRTAVRLAIKNTIRTDILKPGDLIPSEQELTRILGVSLGTIQAALGQLRDLGIISRRRGDGTRVTDQEPLTDSIWHFRFLSRNDQTPLRIKDENLRIETTSQMGEWSNYLGRCERYIRIWRSLQMRDGSFVGAEMYLSHPAALALSTIDESELKMANIRPYLEKSLGLVISGATHCVKTTKIDEATANRFGLEPLDNYYEIHAKAYSPNRQPVYFQKILVSSTNCILEF